MTFITGANNKATSTTPSITVPATASVGDILVIHFDQNNTDASAGAPTGLTLQASDSTVAGYPSKLYTATVDGTTITAGGTLTWPTLSASRAWTLDLIVERGVTLTGLQVSVGHAATSPVVIPSLTTTATDYLIEVAAGKSNGTAITSWTPPSGWTLRQTVTAGTTFGGSTTMATLTADGTSSASTYGGETYTPSSAAGAYVSYLLALPSASSTNGSVTAVAATQTWAANAPVVTGTTVTSGGGPATISMSATAPVVTGGAVVSAVAATVTFSAAAPVVTASGNVTVTAVAATVTISAPAPVVTGEMAAVVQAVAAGMTLSAVNPPTVVGVVATVYYLYSPPTWNNVGVMAGSLRFSIPTSTTTYRKNGQWYNAQSPGMGVTDGADYVFPTPTMVSQALRDEMIAADVPGTFS